MKTKSVSLETTKPTPNRNFFSIDKTITQFHSQLSDKAFTQLIGYGMIHPPFKINLIKPLKSKL